MMQIDVCTDHHRLVSEMEQDEVISTKVITMPDESTVGQALFICDSRCHHNDVIRMTEMGYQHVFYYVHEASDIYLFQQIKTICDSMQVNFISPELTEKQIIQRIVHVLDPNQTEGKSNVITFLSPIPNIGLTSTVLSAAHTLGDMIEGKVCVLGLNAWDDGVDQMAYYNGKFLNEVKTQLTNRMLDYQSFTALCHKEESFPFYYLAGNQNTKMERLFTIDEIDYLITLAKEAFDLVIIDAGCHWDNANMLQSLHHANLKILVVNQQRKAIKKFEQVYQHILYPLGYKRSEFLLVMNDYRDENGLPSEKDVYSELNIPYLTSIPHVRSISIHAEINQGIMTTYEVEEYSQSMTYIARGIVSRTKLKVHDPQIKEKTKRKWGFLAKIGG